MKKPTLQEITDCEIRRELVLTNASFNTIQMLEQLRSHCRAYASPQGQKLLSLAALMVNDPFQCWHWIRKYSSGARRKNKRRYPLFWNRILHRYRFVRPTVYRILYPSAEPSPVTNCCGDPTCVCPWHLLPVNRPDWEAITVIQKALGIDPSGDFTEFAEDIEDIEDEHIDSVFTPDQDYDAFMGELNPKHTTDKTSDQQKALDKLCRDITAAWNTKNGPEAPDGGRPDLALIHHTTSETTH